MTTALDIADMSALSLYYRDVKRVDRLTREEEVELACKWRDQQCLKRTGTTFAVCGLNCPRVRTKIAVSEELTVQR